MTDDKKKKSYSGGSMYNFFKQNQPSDGTAIKKELLARGRQAIVQEYVRDWEDRGRLNAVDGARRRELESACQVHVKELDMRYNTMYEIDGLLS